MATFAVILILIAVLGLCSDNAICSIIGLIAFLIVLFVLKGLGAIMAIIVFFILWFGSNC